MQVDRTQIAEILVLQERAYRLLMSIGDRARQDPSVLSAEAEHMLADAKTCLTWLRTHPELVPASCQCPGKERELAALLSSFLRASFHVVHLEWNGKLMQAELRTGAAHQGTRAAKRARHGGSLAQDALSQLCREEGLHVSPAGRGRLGRSLGTDLHTWCYAVGLLHRARGQSEGESDWKHWRSIPFAERKSMDVEMVWAARARLVERLRAVEVSERASLV